MVFYKLKYGLKMIWNKRLLNSLLFFDIEDPAVKQIAVGLLTAAITKAAGGNASAAASAGISTEKYNYLTHEEYEEIIKSITRYNHKALGEGEILDRHRDEEWLEEHKNDWRKGG